MRQCELCGILNGPGRAVMPKVQREGDRYRVAYRCTDREACATRARAS